MRLTDCIVRAKILQIECDSATIVGDQNRSIGGGAHGRSLPRSAYGPHDNGRI